MRFTVKKVSLDNLTIAPEVQRLEGLDQLRVNKIAPKFDPSLLGEFVISERPDGRYVVLDGMHRLALCRQVGHSDLVNCIVFSDLSGADEATIALGYNDKKLVSAITTFDWRVKAGDKIANSIATIAKDHQWQIGISNSTGYIAAVSALERVYRNGGGTVPEGEHPELLNRVLEILTIAWEWDGKSVDAAMLLAVAQLIGRLGASVDTKKLVAEMQDTRPGVLIGRAKTLRDAQGGSLPAALAKILVSLHNKKRRTNLLPEWVWIR